MWRSSAKSALNRAGERASDVAAHAGPVVRSAASTTAEQLGEAAGRAADLLTTAAERLAAEAVHHRPSVAAVVAPPRRSKKNKAVRALALTGVLVAGGVLVARSPLGAKLRARFRPEPEELDTPSITLPPPTGRPASPSVATPPTGTIAMVSNGVPGAHVAPGKLEDR